MTTYPVAAKRLLRETLLDAADAMLDERPWAKISMGEVARRAGVSRQTLYNELGGRRELAEAFVTTRDAVLNVAVERLSGVIERTWPGVDRAAARRLTEIVVRLGISHATLPTGTPDRTARDVAIVLGPHIDALVPRESSQAA